MSIKQSSGTARPASTQFPQWRRLRGYAFDPGLSQQFETAKMNEIVFRVPWERLEPGPVGEYVEVIDHDPASQAYYEPVLLDAVEGTDGLEPDEGNPKFHQQFVYAVAMTTIRNFELALGRRVLWSNRDESRPAGEWDEFVERLRIYPHAFRGANAFYSPKKNALLFGYFPASASSTGAQLPGGLVFTCLSHDIIAHETTHALLDATLPKFLLPTNRDALAFHEAFADIVALFQHFSFPDVLRDQIAKTRGDLASQSLLGQLAQQFGQATGMYGALREAIGHTDAAGKWVPLAPDPSAYETTEEPHARGALLVAAVFDAFLAIYRDRVADLFRIATGGSGVLAAGALPPDLIDRLTAAAAKTARHVLGICIRALDYCPPVDLTFPDYLRALITADVDLVPDDERNYRVAIIEAFRKRGIYPHDLRTVSEKSLCWPNGDGLDVLARDAMTVFAEDLRPLLNETQYRPTRRDLFEIARKFQTRIHGTLVHKIGRDRLGNLAAVVGLELADADAPPDPVGEPDNPRFEVHSVRPAKRRGPHGEETNQVVIALTQRRTIDVNGESLTLHGGCTLILDLATLALKYAIGKPVGDSQREASFCDWLDTNPTAAALGTIDEPIAYLHLNA